MWAVAYFITKAVPRAYQLKFKQVSPTLSVFYNPIDSLGLGRKDKAMGHLQTNDVENSALQKKARELELSPLFNVSLANKELFHSNFLAWLGETYPTLFLKLMSDVLGKKLEISTEIRIEREYHNFDIAVFETGRDHGCLKLIIENKVKSIPSLKQLQEYEKRVAQQNGDKVICVLLSISPDLQDNDINIKKTNWHFVDYKKLSSSLSSLWGKEVENHYHAELIKDYCSYMDNLQYVIDTMCDIHTNNKYFYEEPTSKMIEKLRINDICGKRRIQAASLALKNLLQKNNIEIVNTLKELMPGERQILVGFGFTNGMPLLEARFKTKTDEYILVQVQGKQYRHCIEFFDTPGGALISKQDKGAEPSEKGIQMIKDKYLDIFFGPNALTNYPKFKDKKFGQRGAEQGFCKYCNGSILGPNSYHSGKISCFVYQWVEIPDNSSISELVRAVHEDILNLMGLIFK